MTAVVFDSSPPIRLGGLTLAERNRRLLTRIGVSAVRVAHSAADVPPATSGLIAIAPDVLLETATLRAFVTDALNAPGSAAVLRDVDGPLLAFVPADRVAASPGATFDDVVADLEWQGGVEERTSPGFVRRIRRATAAGTERDYVRHLNGGSTESFFTKIIRRFSVPLSIHLARLGASPTQVTLGGLALAIAAAILLAQGHYAAGVAGALLYYASMVFDCSDGEVARLTVRDSAFGAWLETMVDYATYFLVLGALAWSIGDRPGAGGYRAAAWIALAGSIAVAAIASYMRHRVAAADPGQFDESSARALASAGRVHRFARWGRQWIKRSTIAHLIVALAIAGQLHVLLYLWAFGAAVGTAAILFVQPFVARRVRVPPVELGKLGAGR